MSFNKSSLDDYQEVPDRIRQFFDKYPEGSLQRVEWHVETIGEQTFIVYSAAAFRSPNDTTPGEGTAWEPFPGTTPYTKNSELMNAETSAWGRALVALGFVAKKIASAEEVRNRSAEKANRYGYFQDGVEKTDERASGRVGAHRSPRSSNGGISNEAARALVSRATEVVDLDRLRLAATHVAKRDIGKCETNAEAVAALKSFSPEQAKRLAEWIEQKDIEAAS